MRPTTLALIFAVTSILAGAQNPSRPEPVTSPAGNTLPASSETVTLPAGTKVLLSLRSALSTQTAKPGDAVYLETSFPVTQDDRIVIPGGSYVKGVIDSVKKAGRVKGRAEMQMHFTTLIFNNGYTVHIPGTIDTVPGMENGKVLDKEGKIQAKGQKGRDAGTMAGAAATGAMIGGASAGLKGAGIGSGIGAVAGLAKVLLTKGDEIRFLPGTSVEMVLERPLVLEAARLQASSSLPDAGSNGRGLLPSTPRNPDSTRLPRPVLTPAPEPR